MIRLKILTLSEKWLKLQYNSLISMAACIIGHYLAACIICLYLRPVLSTSISVLYHRPVTHIRDYIYNRIAGDIIVQIKIKCGYIIVQDTIMCWTQ